MALSRDGTMALDSSEALIFSAFTPSAFVVIGTKPIAPGLLRTKSITSFSDVSACTVSTMGTSRITT